MTDETTQQDSNIQISVEQICAAILKTIGSIQVPLEDLVANYGGKTIAIEQDQDTKAVTFALADAPSVEQTAETDSAE
jgi:hypothetical protein